LTGPRPLLRGALAAVMASALGACAGTGTLTPSEERAAAERYAELGLRYLEQGSFDLALARLKYALELDPDHASAHHYLGKLYTRLGRTMQADAEYRRALALAPDDAGAHNDYGVFLCLSGRTEDAEHHLHEALRDEDYETSGLPYENLGRCARRNGDPDSAARYFQQALDLNPLLPRVLWQMADLHYEREQWSRARTYLRRYHSVASRTPQSLWMAIAIERRLGNPREEERLSMVLKRRFPDSSQARALTGEAAQAPPP
jgi:type IV pilus assembly protein PilF